ncbi:MAG: hypothetical protein HYS73_01210 [Parcubacteria group bacterium]|nr:hypothetical protein [Parcubacteria group bacterium]
MAKTETKSLAPFGDTLPGSRRRLESVPGRFPNDPEAIMMRLWEEENISRTGVNFGGTIVEAILCLGEEIGDHAPRGKTSKHDRRVVAATIQWMATNCGRALFYEFERRLARAHQEYLDRVAPGQHTAA